MRKQCPPNEGMMAVLCHIFRHPHHCSGCFCSGTDFHRLPGTHYFHIPLELSGITSRLPDPGSSCTAVTAPPLGGLLFLQVLASQPDVQPPGAPSNFLFLQLPTQPHFFSTNGFAFCCLENRGREAGRPSDSFLKTYPHSTHLTSCLLVQRLLPISGQFPHLGPHSLQLPWQPPIITCPSSFHFLPYYPSLLSAQRGFHHGICVCGNMLGVGT